MVENNREEFRDRHKEPYAVEGHKTYSDSSEYPGSEDEQVVLPPNWKWRKFCGDAYVQHRSLGSFYHPPRSFNDDGYPLDFDELEPFELFDQNPPLPSPNPALPVNQDGDADDEDNGDDEDGKHSKSNSKKA